MKLRLHRNTIRLRLDARDLRRLGRGESVSHALIFGPGEDQRFTYELRLDDAGGEITAELADRAVIVRMPRSVAEDWAAGDQDGIEAAQFVDDERMLGVLIEKDADCGHARRDASGTGDAHAA